MLISVCIPCMNRTYDLKQTLPHLIGAAEANPPIEIVIVNYNSQDDLEEYVKVVDYDNLVYARYTGRDYFHMAHARNLSVMASSGEWIVIGSTDIFFSGGFFATARELIIRGAEWMHTPHHLKGVVVCRRKEFVDAGGFDERFEYYGAEDRDLEDRMIRRGKKLVLIPQGLLKEIYTPNEAKVANYDPTPFGGQRLLKREMAKKMKAIWLENRDNNILVANQGRAWGQWT